MEDQAGAPFVASEAEKSFARVRPRLEALAVAEVRRPNLDLAVASTRILGVAQAAEKQGLHPRFEGLPEREWDISHLRNLKDLAGACWYVHQLRLAGRPFETTAKLSDKLAQDARALRKEMLRVASYNLERDPVAAKTLADIRRGSGYLDLSMDLSRVAQLYQDHAATLAKDTGNYRAEDVAKAQALAQQIREELGAPEAGSWDDMAFRAWTAMVVSYGEVTAAAGWLFRREPTLLALFPPLAANA